MLLAILLLPYVSAEDNCPIEDYLAKHGIRVGHVKYYAIGAVSLFGIMLLTILTLSLCLCDKSSKLHKKKAKVSNSADRLSDERGYSKFLEYQHRYMQSAPSTIQPTTVHTFDVEPPPILPQTINQTPHAFDVHPPILPSYPSS